MLRAAIAIALVIAINGSASAKIESSEFVAACMALDNGTPKKCSCMAKSFAKNLGKEQQTYALAMLTLNEKLLKPYNGSLEDKTTDAVKTKIIPLMMGCLL